MNLKEIEREIAGLSVSEKLILVEDLWDSIERDQQKLKMPVWHKEELDKRLAQKVNDPGENWESVHAGLRKSVK